MSLLARYAESLFWMARYTERAASLARIIEMHAAHAMGGRERETSWAWIVRLYADDERFGARHSEATLRNVIDFYVDDAANPGSIRAALRASRENARALRPFAPTEMWVQMNEFYNRIAAIGPDDLDANRLSRTCSAIKYGCYAQLGVADSTLYRDEGWRFFRLGLLIERADQTSRLLDVKFAQRATSSGVPTPADESVFWAILLRSAAAYQAFRRFEPRGADPDRVARFLLFNASHPRSIGFCVSGMQAMLNELRSGYRLLRTGRALEMVEDFTNALQEASDSSNLPERLHFVSDLVQRNLLALTSELATTFFAAAPAAVAIQESASEVPAAGHDAA